MRIVKLQVENVKRLSAVNITPDADGNLVVLGGDNGEGKSSVLDSIIMTLGGAKTVPETALRKGAKAGKIVIDLGEYIVTRTFREGGTSQVSITNKDGAKYGTPQSILDGFYGKLTFDPLAFSKMGGSADGRKKQGEIVRQLVGLDFTKWDEERAEIFEERTAANKDVDKFAAQLLEKVRHPDAPAAEQSAEEITRQITEATNHNNSIDDAGADMQRIVEDGRSKAQQIADTEGDITRLESELAEAKARLVTQQAEKEAMVSKFTAAQTAYKAMKRIDTTTLMASLTSINEINAKVRDNAAWADKQGELAEAQGNVLHLSDRIDKIDKDKKEAIAAADMPITGLSFTDGGEVLFNELPLDQASGAEQLRVSMAIGAALNPKLRVMLCKDGALLDDKSLALLAEFAKDKDYQIWLEDCRAGDRATVTIVDGQVEEAK